MHNGFKWLIISDLNQLDKFREVLGLGTCLSFDDAFEKISNDVETEHTTQYEKHIAMHPGEEVGNPPYLRDMEKAKRRTAFVITLAAAEDGPVTYYTLLDPKDVDLVNSDARKITTGFVRDNPLSSMRFKYKVPEATSFLARTVVTLLDGEFTLIRKGVDLWPHLPTNFKLAEVPEALPERTWVRHERDLNGINTWFSQDRDVMSLMVREGDEFVVIISVMPTTILTKEQTLEHAKLLYLNSGKEVIFDSRYEEHMQMARSLDPAPFPQHIYSH